MRILYTEKLRYRRGMRSVKTGEPLPDANPKESFR